MIARTHGATLEELQEATQIMPSEEKELKNEKAGGGATRIETGAPSQPQSTNESVMENTQAAPTEANDNADDSKTQVGNAHPQPIVRHIDVPFRQAQNRQIVRTRCTTV